MHISRLIALAASLLLAACASIGLDTSKFSPSVVTEENPAPEKALAANPVQAAPSGAAHEAAAPPGSLANRPTPPAVVTPTSPVASTTPAPIAAASATPPSITPPATRPAPQAASAPTPAPAAVPPWAPQALAARPPPSVTHAPTITPNQPAAPTSAPPPARTVIAPAARPAPVQVTVFEPMPPAVALTREAMPELARAHTLDLTTPASDIWSRIRNGFAIPNLISPLVTERQAWYLTKPEYFLRTIERSGMYLHYIVEELEKRNMPTELALLPFVESAYNPMAYSRARASGMWQFIPSTGKSFNLRQDWWRDERRDIIASTEAALTYLQAIYDMHGDWHLALASYNWGENAVKRAIEKNAAQGLPTDYLSLNMPEETRHYIPKLQAIKNIIALPGLFSLKLPHIGNEPYFATIVKKRDIDIITAAKLAGMPLDEFRALNPSFNRPVITGNTQLLVPADKLEIFQINLANHDAPLSSWQRYIVKRGDNQDQVARRFGMTLASLRDVNDLAPRTRLVPGRELLVRSTARQTGVRSTSVAVRSAPVNEAVSASAKAPARATPTRAAAATSKAASKSAPAPRVYVVRRGDTLFAIAQRFDLTVEFLRQLNRLSNSVLAVGQRLRLQ